MNKVIVALVGGLMVFTGSAYAFENPFKWYEKERVYYRCEQYGMTRDQARKVEESHKRFSVGEKSLAFATGSSLEPSNVKSFCETLRIALRNLKELD